MAAALIARLRAAEVGLIAAREEIELAVGFVALVLVVVRGLAAGFAVFTVVASPLCNPAICKLSCCACCCCCNLC